MDFNNLKEMFNFSFDNISLQIVLLIFGLLLIIIALFRPKENQLIEEKIENIFDEFINQIDLENKEIIKKIEQTHERVPRQIDSSIKKLEERIEQLEQAKKELATPYVASTEQTIPVNHKYEEVLRLYNSGEDIDGIAKKTQMGHAEIKLILELNKKGFKYV